MFGRDDKLFEGDEYRIEVIAERVRDSCQERPPLFGDFTDDGGGGVGQVEGGLAAVVGYGHTFDEAAVGELDDQAAGGGDGNTEEAGQFGSGDPWGAANVEEDAQLGKGEAGAFPFAEPLGIELACDLPVEFPELGGLLFRYHCRYRTPSPYYHATPDELKGCNRFSQAARIAVSTPEALP